MNVMVTDLYDALLSAGADEAKARKAAEGFAPTDTGLEPRVARIESDVAHVKTDIQEMKTDLRGLRSEISGLRSEISDVRSEQGGIKERLARLETKVDHLPTKGYVITSLILLLGLMTALIGFQRQLQIFLGQPVAPVTATP